MRRARISVALVACGALALVCAGGAPGEAGEGAATAALEVASGSFDPGGEIPREHTCQGDDLSPELHWSGVPEGARSLALIVDDPDAPDPKAPKTTWVHWVLYDIPSDATGLPEGVAAGTLPPGTREGRNGWKHTGYRGPCPPIGRHRYFHRLYALGSELGDLDEPTKDALLAAMQGKVLAQGELVGTYEKRGD